MKELTDTRLLQKIAFVTRELRKEEGLTQEDVFRETNINVGRIETAKSNISISTLSSLCKYFEISLSDFFKRVETYKK